MSTVLLVIQSFSHYYQGCRLYTCTVYACEHVNSLYLPYTFTQKPLKYPIYVHRRIHLKFDGTHGLTVSRSIKSYTTTLHHWDGNAEMRMHEMRMLRWECWDGNAEMGMLRWECWDGNAEIGMLRWECWDGNAEMGMLRWERWDGNAEMGMLRWECWDGNAEMGMLRWECWDENGNAEMGMLRWECWDGNAEMGMLRWECWDGNAEMWMLRWARRKTKKNHIKNEEFWRGANANLPQTFTETHETWYGHVLKTKGYHGMGRC